MSYKCNSCYSVTFYFCFFTLQEMRENVIHCVKYLGFVITAAKVLFILFIFYLFIYLFIFLTSYSELLFVPPS